MAVKTGDTVWWEHYVEVFPPSNENRPRNGLIYAQKGVVRDAYDPTIWAGTAAFLGAKPDPKAVREHVESERANGRLVEMVPVEYEGGRICWTMMTELKKQEPQPRPASTKVPKEKSDAPAKKSKKVKTGTGNFTIPGLDDAPEEDID